MGEKLKVLVVDDDRRMVKTICDILIAKGYSAEPAYSGEEAVERVKTDALACVLMDLKMEGMDGIETLKLLKEVAPDLPVVMMSAYATEEQVEEARRSGAYSLLTKPVDIQMVVSFLSLLRKEKSILVVDDDPAFCRTLKEILGARGYRVETEGDVGRVLGHMEKEYQLLVILDLKLNNANGMEVLGEIRSRYPTKPVVLVTGNRSEAAGSIEMGRRIGAYTCLYKPFESEEMIRIIEDVSRRKLRAFLGEPYTALEEQVWTKPAS
jgi:DNA-binding NtrC family response regulator